MPMLNIGHIPPGAMNEHLLNKLGWQMANLPLEIANAFSNQYLAYGSEHPEEVEEMRELLAMSPGRILDITKMEKKSGPILVVGSGGSLDQCMPRIKEWKGAVMCSTSQGSTLVKHGRYPDYVVCLDPRVAPADELAASDWGPSVMVGHVSIPYEYVKRWLKRATGAIYVGRIMEPSYEWYSHNLGKGYPWIRHIMMPMIDSGAAEIGFATWLGYSPIYIVGLDYGGPRFDRYDWHYDTQTWTLDADTSKFDAATVGEQGLMQMSYASRGSLMSSFFQMANEKYHQRIYNFSKVSALRQFPKKDWDTVLDGEPEGSYDAKSVMDEIEMALAVWDTYLIPMQGGWGIDYMTFVAKEEEQLMFIITKQNGETLNNLKYFAEVEKQQGKPLPELIANGIVTQEAGELLLHKPEEFGTWDWHKIRPVDILMVLLKRRWLLEEARKHGYSRSNEVPPPMKEMMRLVEAERKAKQGEA